MTIIAWFFVFYITLLLENMHVIKKKWIFELNMLLMTLEDLRFLVTPRNLFVKCKASKSKRYSRTCYKCV